MAHTPGPWAQYDLDPFVIIDSDGSSLGEMTAGDPLITHAEMLDNARLTAAAPDLLEALQLALEYWAHRQQRYKNRHPAWVTAARAAIARAGG